MYNVYYAQAYYYIGRCIRRKRVNKTSRGIQQTCRATRVEPNKIVYHLMKFVFFKINLYCDLETLNLIYVSPRRLSYKHVPI